jgi:hypothetical protein
MSTASWRKYPFVLISFGLLWLTATTWLMVNGFGIGVSVSSQWRVDVLNVWLIVCGWALPTGIGLWLIVKH